MSATINVNTRKLWEGDLIAVTTEAGRTYVLRVWHVGAAGEAGSAYYHGPSIHAHIAPGRWGITFDESGCAGIVSIDPAPDGATETGAIA